jgi:hypothetical protein
MRIRILFIGMTTLLLAAAGSAQAGDDVELVRLMGTMQYMTHKASLAIGAKNQPLAAFYVHEVEEVIEKLESIESYDGHAIGELVETLLVPSFAALEETVDSGDWAQADKRVDQLLSSCNACHETTEHAYIRIRRSTTNPFMQDFAPR